MSIQLEKLTKQLVSEDNNSKQKIDNLTLENKLRQLHQELSNSSATPISSKQTPPDPSNATENTLLMLKDNQFSNEDKQFGKNYNPFIHGTTSSILAFLPKTEFQFLPPLQMIDKYGLAPMSGEIAKGGLESLNSTGNICFGRLKYPNALYTMEYILKNYTTIPFKAPKIDSLKYELQYCLSKQFSTLNESLIAIARAKQWDLNIKEISEIQEIEKHIYLTQQFFYLCLCLGNYITLNLFELDEYAKNNDVRNVFNGIYSYFTPGNIKALIDTHQLNLEEIWKNPNQDNLQALINVLCLPTTEFEVTCAPDNKSLKKITLPKIRLFHVIDHNLKLTVSKEPYRRPDLFFKELLSIDGGLNTAIEDVLSEKFESNTEDRNLPTKDKLNIMFINIQPRILKYLEQLKIRLNSLQSVLSKDYSALEFSAQEKAWIEEGFPIIIVNDDESFFKLTSSNGEYRTNVPLLLGKHISIMATDTERHKEVLEQYLNTHCFNDVEVVLFEELAQGKRPISSRPSA